MAVRKAILDYVLKDEEQRRRLGLQNNPNPPEDYGTRIYKGIEPNEEWQTNVMMARMLMSDNLCICSPATLGLSLLWKEYESLLLVDLPNKYECLPFNSFIERQEKWMGHVKELLLNDWTQSAVNIITEEVKNMDKE